MYSTLQLISTERKVGNDILQCADSANKQPQHAGGHQANLATMDVHTTQWSGFTILTLSSTMEQGATLCSCTSIDCCLRTRDQSLQQYSSVGMMTLQ